MSAENIANFKASLVSTLESLQGNTLTAEEIAQTIYIDPTLSPSDQYAAMLLVIEQLNATYGQ